MIECNACGEPTKPNDLYPHSNWCITCVENELADQAAENTDRITPQIFTP